MAANITISLTALSMGSALPLLEMTQRSYCTGEQDPGLA